MDFVFLLPTEEMRLPHTCVDIKNKKKMPKNLTIMISTFSPTIFAYLSPTCGQKYDAYSNFYCEFIEVLEEAQFLLKLNGQNQYTICMWKKYGKKCLRGI